ncbi:MAG: transketolase C-terminal domain-containing protein [Candidatus Aceula meridiana]|nr:transketolase C-terminal domain-containing protein [Candidatus Aceula meridiana]
MRKAFIQELVAQARIHPDIFLIVGDLGFSVIEPFVEEFPERFLNAGIAEQNMAGVAAGLAYEGYRVFIYSIANFPTLRCFEQIRNDICYHSLPVTIVSVGGGLSYGSQGYSHYGLEDLAVMRVLPGLTVIAPGDPVETRLALRDILRQRGPCYLRLGKTQELKVYENEPEFQIGKALILSEGSDITLISTGGVLEKTVKAAQELKRKNISATVLSMHTLSPLDKESLLKWALATGRVMTIEEHGAGGLAAVVSEVLAMAGKPLKFVCLYLRQNEIDVSGSQEYLCRRQGISDENIVQTALTMCK